MKSPFREDTELQKIHSIKNLWLAPTFNLD
jgi:hypothetical protein